MTIDITTRPAAGGAAASRGIVGAALGLWRIYRRWRDAWFAIDRLSAMTDEQLNDIGISRLEIEDAVWHGRSATGRYYWDSRFW